VLTSAGAFQARGSHSCAITESARLSVVDVETTGLDPEVSRVVECAIVTCSGRGDVIDEWSSLISVPGVEKIGTSWLHGITRATLDGAPAFADVAGEVARRLRGTIVVGHFVDFDLSHLRNEFHRIGARFPELCGATICTRDLAGAHLPSGSRTLAAVCARLGLVRSDAHTALGDALATASVLAAFVARGADLGWGEKMGRAREAAWPTFWMSGQRRTSAPACRRSR
jgi:DNA polymerase III epsilon subunit family exonuclease